MSRFGGCQLTGRFPWPAQLIEAGRRYTREDSTENLRSLEDAKRSAASEIIGLQSGLGFEHITDGGVGFLDAFTPYSVALAGSASGGNIDKYPGTRNSYYHTPVVKGELKGGSQVEKHLYASEIGAGKKKAILPSPASLALASENSHYDNLEELMSAFGRVLREDVRALEGAGYGMIQLNECFLTVDRFKKKAGEKLAGSLAGCIDEVFKGARARSCIYFHAGDASALLPGLLDTSVTDIGFDFHTPLQEAASMRFDKNLLLGLQNTTRKLPDEWLFKEPKEIAVRYQDYAKSLKVGDGRQLYLCPSQDYDGLQTYPQARRRLENLASAAAIVGGKGS